ncbi:MAG: transcriptional repressor [Alphaproteobacteria bacterium]|nr:transcriptional repressor [Alphaproteobacteria bacterium]
MQKLTRNQEVVINALRAAEQPLSAYQILDLEKVREKGLKAPLTIYRALDKLIEQGLVHRIESLNAFVICDHEPHSEPAAFMICEVCRSTIEFSTDQLRRSIARYARQHGFHMAGMHLEVSGRCETCAAA